MTPDELRARYRAAWAAQPDEWDRASRIDVAAGQAAQPLRDVPFADLAALVEALGMAEAVVDEEFWQATPRAMLIGAVEYWLRREGGYYSADATGDGR